MAKKRKARRTRSPHPGVVLAARTLPSGGTSWRARYRDPLTGRVKWETLDASLSNAEKRTKWASDKSESLARQRVDLAAGIAPAPKLTTIDDAIKTYMESASVRLRPRTLKTYTLAIERFRAWCKAERIEHTHQLTPAALANLRDDLVRQPKRAAARGEGRGKYRRTRKPRSPVTINQHLRTLATLLTSWRRRGLVPLSSDEIADGMRRLPVERELPTFLSPADLKRLIRACLKHDAETFDATRAELAGDREPGTTPRYAAIAPVAVFLLTTGMRRGEALTLRWADVDLEALDASGAKVGEIRLRAADVKTRIARVVGLEVSPGLRKILAAMKLQAGDEERVFPDVTGDVLASSKARLVGEYGAPSFTWQALRSTCATYLVNAPAIYGSASAFLAARQLGHSVVVAERRYAGQLRGLPRGARTLDAAMQIEAELRDVLASIATPPARASKPR